jgi:hypothetical protein
MSLLSGDVIGGGLIAWASGAGTPSDLYTAATATKGRCYLVELYPYQRGATTGARLFVRGIGTPESLIAYSSPLAANTGIAEFDFSDARYVSPHASASKPDTYFDPRVSQPIRLSRSLPLAPEGSRRVALEIGGIELLNPDGELDTVLDQYAIDGRKIVVKFGEATWNYQQFTAIYTGRAVSWKRDFETIEITARDEAYRFNVPLQSSLYSGAGGVNGTAQIQGKPLPVCFGQCTNITPVQIDPTNLVYQFHTRTVQSVDAVYDRGAALTGPDADYANYALLTAAVITAGHYVTCKALGLIRLASTPSGLVTADVKGDASGSYISTTFAIAKRILTDFAGVATSELDVPSFDTMTTNLAGAIGWYRSTEAITIEQALNEIVGHCSGWWGGLQSGLISVGRVEAPNSGQVAADWQDYDAKDAKIIDAPPGTFPPRWRQRVAYAKNWTLQRGEDLAASVTATRRQLLAEPYSVVSSISASAQSDYLLAQDPPVLETLYVSSADAQTEADRLISMFGVQRQTVDIVQGTDGHLINVGQTVQLTYPRINQSATWLARVVAQEIDAAKRTITSTLWG